MNRDSGHLYAIVSNEDYSLFAGVVPDERQVLMGLLCPNLVAFYFDSKGNLLNVEERSVSFFQGADPPYNIYDNRIPALISTWQEEMDFQPAVIKVKKFFSQETYVQIEDYPSDFEETLADYRGGAIDRGAISESIRQWDEEGSFVLWWGNDYWLNDSGEVVSS